MYEIGCSIEYHHEKDTTCYITLCSGYASLFHSAFLIILLIRSFNGTVMFMYHLYVLTSLGVTDGTPVSRSALYGKLTKSLFRSWNLRRRSVNYALILMSN